MGKELVPSGKVKLTDKQADNLGREGNPFSKGTYVVVPAQICHPKPNPVTTNEEYKFIPAVHAFILDENKKVIAEKNISKAQFCKQTFGIGEIVVKRVQNSNGNWFGDRQANFSNINVPPKFGFVIEDGEKNWALKEGFAVKVGDLQLHSTPVLEQKDGKWGYQQDKDNREICAIRKVMLNDLTAVSFTDTYPEAKLPEGWNEYTLGDKVVYMSNEEAEKEGQAE